MSQIDKEKTGRASLLTGNWGEQYIAERLSACDCFIRHVPQGHDTGIDLYCETTANDKSPFLHFWCQVKTRNFKGRNERVTLSRKSMKRVDYWLKQPVPVFIFVVPDLRKDCIIPFYIFSVIDFYPHKHRISSLLKVEKREDLEIFLNEKLPIETFRWDLMRGRVSHLAASRPEYIIRFPKGQALEFKDELQESLRWTLRILADDILDKNTSDSISNAKSYVEMLETLVSSIHDKHYESYEVIGDYYCKKDESEKAVEYYQQSLALLSNDPNINKGDNQWKGVCERIKGKIQLLESGKRDREAGFDQDQDKEDVCATRLTHNE